MKNLIGREHSINAADIAFNVCLVTKPLGVFSSETTVTFWMVARWHLAKAISSYYTSHSLWKIRLVESIQSMLQILADIAFIMSSSTSAWLQSPLECSPQKQNGWTLRFCFWGWIMWKMYNKTIIEFSFRMISWIIKPRVCVICLSLRLRQITQTSVLIIRDIMLNRIQ